MKRSIVMVAVLMLLFTSQYFLPGTQGIALKHSNIHRPKYLPKPATPVFSAVQSYIREVSVPQNNSDPLAINIDAMGNVWFAETNPPAIAEYVPAVQTFQVFPVPTGKSCGLIWFLIHDNASNLWFSCASEPLLWSFSTNSFQFSNFSTGNARVDPYSLLLDSRTNQLWFTSIYTDQIGAFQVSSDAARLDFLVNVSGPPSAKSLPGAPRFGPSGLAMDTNGNLFVTETFAPAIAEYSPLVQKFEKIWTLPDGAQPVGIVVDNASQRIWFTNHGSSLVGFVNESSGAVKEFATSLFNFEGSYEATLPYWIQQAPNGEIWFDEHIGNKMASFDDSTNQLTEFYIPTPLSAPLRFATDDSRKVVWFTEFQGDKLGELDENQSCTCTVTISSRSIALSSSSTNLTVNYNLQSGSNFTMGTPSVSGSLSAIGILSSNLSLSFTTLNSTAFGISIDRAANLSAGNYSITICPGENDSTLSGWPCNVVPITVLGTGSPTTLTNVDYAILGVAIIIAVTLASLIYVRRWGRS
jgi:virginiamycin B lyase